MICSLLCTRNEKIIAGTLISRGITISENADLAIVEKGLPVPEKGISILFDPNDLNALIEFLDTFLDSFQGRKFDVIPVKSEESYELIKAEYVYFFTAEGNNVCCHTETGRFTVKKKLYELEQELAHCGFVRVSKSSVVNIMKVNEIAPWFGGRLLLLFNKKKEEIEVSRSYVRSFKKFLGL